MVELKNKIENQVFDEERALYNLKDTEVLNCIFAGKQDGESVLKETRNIRVVNSKFSLRYPLWHAKKYELIHSTLINCKIIGTQALCYCKNLKLINCTMENTDLAFEYSEVVADIKGNVVSIKNLKSGTITVDSVGEIINEDSIMEVEGKVIIREK